MTFHCSVNKEFGQCTARERACPKRFHAETMDELQRLIERYEADQYAVFFDYHPECDSATFAKEQRACATDAEAIAHAHAFIANLDRLMSETIDRVGDQYYSPQHDAYDNDELVEVDPVQVVATVARQHQIKTGPILPGQIAYTPQQFVAALWLPERQQNHIVTRPHTLPATSDQIFCQSRITRWSRPENATSEMQQQVLRTTVPVETIQQGLRRCLQWYRVKQAEIIDAEISIDGTLLKAAKRIDKTLEQVSGVTFVLDQPEDAANASLHRCGLIEHEEGTAVAWVTGRSHQKIMMTDVQTPRLERYRIAYARTAREAIRGWSEASQIKTVRRVWQGCNDARLWNQRLKETPPLAVLEAFISANDGEHGMRSG